MHGVRRGTEWAEAFHFYRQMARESHRRAPPPGMFPALEDPRSNGMPPRALIPRQGGAILLACGYGYERIPERDGLRTRGRPHPIEESAAIRAISRRTLGSGA